MPHDVFDDAADPLKLSARKTPIEKIPGYTMTERGPEIFGPEDGPLEAAVTKVEKGPLYVAAEDLIPELQEAVASINNETSKDFALDRRNVLKLFSASAAALTASCIRRPVEKAIPYVNQPVDQAIGVPTNYASTCGECPAACGIVAKTISGLPVKIEGNMEHPVSQGGTCAVGQSTLQALYHPDRRKAPIVKRGTRVDAQSWNDVFEVLAADVKGKKVAIFTGGSTGHQREFYADFLKACGGNADDLYTYEANGLFSSLAQAHQMAYGFEGFPRADLRQASLFLGIGSDFLDLGTSPVFMAKSFSAFHELNEGKMGKHIQFESMLTQTGGRADERHPIAPGTEVVVALRLLKAIVDKGVIRGSAEVLNQARKVAEKFKVLTARASELTGIEDSVFNAVATELVKNYSIVFSGGSATDENATALQLVTILLNELIGAANRSLLLNRGWMRSPVRPGDLQRFLKNAGRYDVVFFIDTNPLFNLPKSWAFEEVLKKIPVLVSMQSFPNEMDEHAHYVLNIHHYLESWGDEQPAAGFYSARQPAVRPVTDSRQAEEVLMWVAAQMKKPMGHADYRSYIRAKWQPVYKTVDAKVEFEVFFDAVLRRGFVGKLGERNHPSMQEIASKIDVETSSLSQKGLVLLCPMDARWRDGRGSFRPVLHEIGDVFTSVAWDSWIAMNPNTAKKLGFRRNDVLRVETASGSFEAALFPLPGVAPEAVVVHRGNGHRHGITKIADDIGVNPLPALAKITDKFSGEPVYTSAGVKLTSTGKIYMLAAMHKSHDLGNRTDIVKKISVDEAASMHQRKVSLDDVPDLYPKLDEGVPYRWGMSVDLTKCTGCGACMAACAVENNVPQVGREQILKRREMHWIRLDRYFEGDVDNPQVSVQPMMCQQCTHAPCEAVCPVLATSHDPEGINAMTYNRCIGTRYCANACPYKVRRFNWWTHKWGVIGEREVDRNPRALNPDVTVRTRGVMEKCNFCAHRVRAAKFSAKNRGNPVRDGELKTACEQVCPSNAIVFGNLKDPASRAAKLRNSPRTYLALGGDPEEGEFGLKTLPNVSYQMQVSYRKTTKHGEHHS